MYTSLQNGTDFLGEGAIDGYRHSDIIVTNPPFSLFRPFISLLDSLNKDFIIWSTNNAIGYKYITSLLVKDKVRLGYIANKTCEFEVPNEYLNCNDSKVYSRDNKNYVKVAGITVFTTLKVNNDCSLNLKKKFDDSYFKYDNFDAINCDKTSDIPIDYDGYIGVPITYLPKHNPDKFKIIGVFNNFKELDYEHGQIIGSLVDLTKPPWKTCGPVVNGNPTYVRLIIQKK